MCVFLCLCLCLWFKWGLTEAALLESSLEPKKSDHITPVLASLHWLPVKARADFNVLLLAYKALHGLAPTYLSDLVLPNIPTCTLQSQDAGLLTVPRISKQTAGGRAFSYSAPFLLRGLPIICLSSVCLLSLYWRLISSVGPMIECCLAQSVKVNGKALEWRTAFCCLCLAGSPLSTGILCL